MSILNDVAILKLCEQGMLTPYDNKSIRKLEGSGTSVISHGISPFGYDVKLHRDVQIVYPGLSNNLLVDPKRPETYKHVFAPAHVYMSPLGEEYVILPPGAFALGKCVPRFKLPDSVTAFCMTKSTTARVGVSVKTTPIQAGYEGDVVLEIKNDFPYDVKLYINEGIAQFFFFEGYKPEVCYATSGGVYQGQEGITLSHVKG